MPTLTINSKPLSFVETPYYHDTTNMIHSPTFEGIGVVTGDPGTGKTFVTHYLTHTNLNFKRICLFQGMTRKDLLLRIAHHLGFNGAQIAFSRLVDWVSHEMEANPHITFLLDESNHFEMRHFESIRYLIDEHGAKFVLFGTSALTHNLYHSKNAHILLKQFQSRVGSNRISFENIGATEKMLFVEALIKPLMLEKELNHKLKMGTISAFWKVTQGNWRIAKRLIDACSLYMLQTNVSEFNTEVVEIAAQYMAS